MSTRRVTKEIRDHIWPLLRGWGFTGFTTRNATRVEPPITTVVNIASLTARQADVVGVPTASFHAAVGVDIYGASPAGFLRSYEPYVPDIAQTHIRALLSKRVDQPGTDDCGLWVVPDDETAVLMVDDLADAMEVQAHPLLEQWTNLDQLYEMLLTADTYQSDGDLGRATVIHPGHLGSINRLQHLAGVSALRGDAAAERSYLEALIATTDDRLYRNRLEELDS